MFCEKTLGDRHPGVRGCFLGRQQALPLFACRLAASIGRRPRRSLFVASTTHRGVRNSRIACRERTITRLSDYPLPPTVHPDAGSLGRLVAQLGILRGACGSFASVLSVASCTGKFHPLPLGLDVTVAEIRQSPLHFAASMRNSPRDWEKIAFPCIKRG